MRWCLRCVLWLWLAIFAGFLARAQAEAPETRELYDRVLSEAISAFKARQWTRARDLFERAHEMSPSARTLRGIGVTAFEGGEYVAAIHALEAALVHPEKQLPEELREGTQVLIEQARERVGTLTLTLTPAEAAVRCDGSDLTREPDGSLLLDPGPHVLSFTAEGFVGQEHGLTIAGKETHSLVVSLEALAAPPPAPPLALAITEHSAPIARASLAATGPTLLLRKKEQQPMPSAPQAMLSRRGRRFFAYGTLAVTVGAIATSAALFARSTELNDELHEWCPGEGGVCPEQYVDAANDRKAKIGRYQRAFGTTIGLGVGAGIASVTLWTLDRIQHRRARRARLGAR
jgi:hypothetical protein